MWNGGPGINNKSKIKSILISFFLKPSLTASRLPRSCPTDSKTIKTFVLAGAEPEPPHFLYHHYSTNIRRRKSHVGQYSVLPVICPTAPLPLGCPAGSHSNSCKFVKSSISRLYLSMTGNTLFIFSEMFFLIPRSGAKIEQRQSSQCLSLSVLRIGKMRSSFI